ncbi:MAG: PAS domain S-box protein [Verrucomicrobia bacterium]|nr:PAS domain S-box protein [Verrucomicrobiota bacterium]
MKPQELFVLREPRQMMLVAACGWTVVSLLFAAFEYAGARHEAVDMAHVNAENSFQKDVAYRHWAAMHGGVYVPVTEKTPPNPLLADWPERDITTPSGRRLTLVNPAYMTRQVHEWSKDVYGVTGHITSLKPINPTNVADAWETGALETFEKGAKEFSSIEITNGEPVLRSMHPFITEKSCLKCHAAQGYKEGDIRGGISVAVSLKPYFAATTENRNDAWLWGGGVWALGLLGLMIGHRRMTQTIQQREESTQQLRETEDRLRLLHDSMLEGVALHEIICDANGQPCDYRFLQVNPAFERLTGLKAADIIGKTVREVYPNIDRKWIERYGRVALTGESCQFEDYSSDVGRHFEVAAVCTRKGQFAATFSDITERKRAQEELRQSEQRYRLLAANMADVLWTLDFQTLRLTYISPSVQRLRGYTAEEAMSQSLGQMLTAKSLAMVQTWLAERAPAFLAGDPAAVNQVYEVELRHKDGSTVWTEMVTTFLRNDDGGINIVGVSRDITDRKRAEDALRQSRAAALNMMEDAVAARDRTEQASETLRHEVEERRRAEDEVRRLNTSLEQRVTERTAELQMANKEMEAFSYSVSHDLRAPVRAMSGFAGMLAEDYAPRLDDEGRRLLGTICSEASRMGQMIDELLAFSRLGRQSMQVAKVDMTVLAQSVFDQCAAQASGRNIQFKLSPLPVAQGDAAMLSHVWVNLISNAIKYTRAKPVAEIEISGRADGKDGIVYCVKDNGAGFDMKYVQKLFGVFQRLHAEADFEGTGVGLALVQRVVQRHGGRVWAEGEVNKGAAFYFALPAGK